LLSSCLNVRPDPAGVVEVFEVLYNPGQAWTYLPGTQFDEALLFKQYDSTTDMPCHTPHAAFTHPATPTDTPPCESIEMRCLLIFD